MFLSIVKTPFIQKTKHPKDIVLGTWFTDYQNQIYVIVHDDRMNENRVLCIGHFYQPFLLNCPLGELNVQDILPVGTLLQITTNTQNHTN